MQLSVAIVLPFETTPSFPEFQDRVSFGNSIEVTAEMDLGTMFGILADKAYDAHAQYLVIKIDGYSRDYVQYQLTKETGMLQNADLENYLSETLDAPIYVRELSSDRPEESRLLWESMVDEL